ncbi:MAG: threonine aldolase, partial [Rhodanobacteraceae bacterium]
PQAISNLDGLEHLRPRIPEFVDRARALAAGLAAIPDLIVHPGRPHTNAFQVWLPGHHEKLSNAHRQFARERKAWLFDAFTDAPLAGHSMAEIQIGPASDGYSVERAVEMIASFVGGARV